MELKGLGRYRLVRELDVVSESCRFFLARHEDESDTGEPSYLAKILRPLRGPDAERRKGMFDHEVKLLKSFNHPCIPTLHAAGDQDGVPYVVSDRVHGITLSALLGHGTDTLQTLSKEIAVYVVAQLADALRHAHTLEYLEGGEPTPLSVVHRDLCPDNIVLSNRGDVVLVGFGKAYSQWLPAAHNDPDAGAVAYKAPERLTGTAANVKTDLFGIAVMLWEALRGQRCFAGENDDATRDAIARFDISQASRRVPGLSPKLSEVLRKNLDRDPERRFPDAYKMLQRLAQSPEAQVAEQSRQQLSELVTAAAG
ncbi:MAG: serine/threonine-protein kinase [Myxococcota bacterium]